MVPDLLRLLLVFSFHLLQVDKLVCRELPSASDHSLLLSYLLLGISDTGLDIGERGHFAFCISDYAD